MDRSLSIPSIALALVGVACWPGAAARAQVGKPVTIADVNLVTEAELAKLPHMSAALARSVVAKRPLTSIRDLDAALGATLSQPQRTELYGRIFVPINLNTAADEEILLIPNLGARMLREFKEYRPYDGLARFHREIGKYVDEKELARLEQYVFVPIDLNTASDQDILSIPGLGARMLREFKEYRPYKAMDQFRREIGKYVSKEEVARLERYVTIK
jgi:DNA uptake protein ComE-like DNA-binding protein